MKKKSSYSYEELIDCANGKLFGPGNAKLPLPPMLMFDRISKIEEKSGTYKKGFIEAELDIKENLWFFQCHFKDDSVMPGCLGLDALWQLTGFNLGWRGMPGRGRALGVGEVKFTDMVTPKVKMITYHVDFTRVINRKLKLGMADGRMFADGKEIYTTANMKVGLFTD